MSFLQWLLAVIASLLGTAAPADPEHARAAAAVAAARATMVPEPTPEPEPKKLTPEVR